MSKENKAKKQTNKSGQRLFLLTEIRIHLLITKFEKMFASQVEFALICSASSLAEVI